MKKKEFKLVKEFLPVDWAKQIAEEIGCTDRYVRMVSKDDRQNDDIDAVIIELAKKGKVAEEKKQERKKQDLNSLK